MAGWDATIVTGPSSPGLATLVRVPPATAPTAGDDEVSGAGKPTLPGSSDPAFRGDPARWNPEGLLVAALAQCRMLGVLHLCAANGIAVTSYPDDAQGTMAEGADGSGQFTSVTLRPRAAIADP